MFQQCARCGGLMWLDKFYGRDDQPYWGWRCVNCGEVVDQIILQNRGRREG
jgi:DNA-directed RNA polymerase subunit RPC12/RpoP